jgi:RNase P subunit RPR2
MVERKRRWYVGFDCRGCNHRIPVFNSAPGEHHRSGAEAALVVMCPQCGFSSHYAPGEAYGFPCDAI